MKKVLALSLIGWVVFTMHSCKGGDGRLRYEQLEERVAELEENNAPGLGLMMNQIQIYHTKLYNAVIHENKPLIGFIIHEMKERFEEVAVVHKVHDEVPISEIAEATILPALDDMNNNLEKADAAKLMEDFEFVTVTCNKCHEASNHKYIRIQKPENEGYLDQDFKSL